MGCLIFPLTMLKKLAVFSVQNGWKGAIVGVLAVIFLIWGAVTIKGCIGNVVDQVTVKPATTTTATTINPTTDEKGIPTPKEAKYQVVTSTRYYYAADATRKPKDVVTSKVYWELVGNTWVKRTTPLVLDEKIFGKVKVLTR